MAMRLHLAILLVSSTLFSQTKVEKEKEKILSEGYKLYESEMASWHGTDLFFEKFNDKSKIGGYVSYTDSDTPRCVFFSKDSVPKVIGTMTFDKTFDLKKADVNLQERNATKLELDLLKLRNLSIKHVQTDTIFKFYKNTNYNFIPIINGEERKVYVLTGPTNHGVVIYGNDYLITFNKNLKITNAKHLHKNIIWIEYGGDKEIVGAVHNHQRETGEFITPTDICTTLLYQKFAGWENKFVMSKKYVSIWDCKKNDLVIMTRDAWEKMNNKE